MVSACLCLPVQDGPLHGSSVRAPGVDERLGREEQVPVVAARRAMLGWLLDTLNPWVRIPKPDPALPDLGDSIELGAW